MPVPEIALHEALEGHSAWTREPSAAGVQISAHCVGLFDPEVSSTHSGLAVAPSE